MLEKESNISDVHDQLAHRLDTLRRDGCPAMPAFYAYTASKIFAVISPILDNEQDAERAMKSLYVDIYKRCMSDGFRPDWSDLLKLARRRALDYKLAGGPVARAPAANGAHHRGLAKPKRLSLQRETILKRVLDPKNPHHKRIKARLKALKDAASSKGGKS